MANENGQDHAHDPMQDGFTLVDGEKEIFYKDAKEAGAAFHHAGKANLPLVVHMQDGNSRFIATTEELKSGGDEPEYQKNIPVAHTPFGMEAQDIDTKFRAGYKEALAESLEERIQNNNDDEPLPLSVHKDLEHLNNINYREEQAATASKESPAEAAESPATEASQEKASDSKDSPEGDSETVSKRTSIASIEMVGPNDFDRDVILARAAENRQRDSHQRDANSQNQSRRQSGHEPLAELDHNGSKRNTVEALAETADSTSWKNRYDINVAGSKSEYFFKDTTDRAFVETRRRVDVDTPSPQVAADIVALAAEKGWSKIKVKGEDDFKHDVWLAATKAGISVEGYSPKNDNRAAKPIQEPDSRPSDSAKKKPKQDENLARSTPEKVTDKEPHKSSTSDFAHAKAANQSDINQSPAESSPVNPNIHVGTLIDAGRAPFQHEKDGQQSFFVKLKNEEGNKTLWGKQLEAALAEIAAKPGDKIELERKGKTPVEVDVPQYNDEGARTGFRKEQRMRTEWTATPVAEPKDSTPKEDVTNQYARASRPSM